MDTQEQGDPLREFRANLGLATTLELLEELEARGRVGRIAYGSRPHQYLERKSGEIIRGLTGEEAVLSYRTVSGPISSHGPADHPDRTACVGEDHVNPHRSCILR
jgi:hypothetical protein